MVAVEVRPMADMVYCREVYIVRKGEEKNSGGLFSSMIFRFPNDRPLRFEQPE